MFNTLKFIIRLLITLVFIFVSPLILLISIAHVKSFKDAIESTLDMIKSPFEEI